MTNYLDWKVGDFVVCVEKYKENPDYAEFAKPVLGVIYQIRALHKFYREEIGIILNEIINPKYHFNTGYDELYFNVDAFRRLDPAKISMFTEMLTKTKDKVDG